MTVKSMKLRELEAPAYKAVEQLHHYSHLTPENYENLKEYIRYLTYEVETYEDVIEWEKLDDSDKRVKNYHKLKSELDWLKKNAQIYTDTRVSIHEMYQVCYRVWSLDCSGYSNNAFFDFKNLVEMINCYYNIAEPTKPSNKVAWGWKFCLQKDKSNVYKGCKLYLWGCIKNYLIQNGIEFDREKSLEVRKIVGLADCRNGDE